MDTACNAVCIPTLADYIIHQVVEKTETGGRKVTREGQQDLDRIAGQVNRGDDE
jgi:ribosomal protein S19E (S16A)